MQWTVGLHYGHIRMMKVFNILHMKNFYRCK
nr:MAG TPA: cytidylyltransferase-like protein [Caudoviricetes sp.]